MFKAQEQELLELLLSHRDGCLCGQGALQHCPVLGMHLGKPNTCSGAG